MAEEWTRQQMLHAYLVRSGRHAPPPREVPEPDQAAQESEEAPDRPYFEQLITTKRAAGGAEKARLSWKGPRPVVDRTRGSAPAPPADGFQSLRAGLAMPPALPTPGASSRSRRVHEMLAASYPAASGEGRAEHELRERRAGAEVEEEQEREAVAVGRLVTRKLGRASGLDEAAAIDTDAEEEAEEEQPEPKARVGEPAWPRTVAAAPPAPTDPLPWRTVTPSRPEVVAAPRPAAVAEASKAPAEPVRDDAPGVCPSCRRTADDPGIIFTCTSCARTACERCEDYDPGLARSPHYAQYRFEFPLCHGCFDRAFKIQELTGRALTCMGVGNLSYARRFAESALQVDPDSKYAAPAVALLERIRRSQDDAKARQADWERTRRMLVHGGPDPAWRVH